MPNDVRNRTLPEYDELRPTPYSNTYNPSYINHQNFSYKNNTSQFVSNLTQPATPLGFQGYKGAPTPQKSNLEC